MEILLTKGKLRSWRKEDAPSLALHANNKKIAGNMRDLFPFPYTIVDANEWLNRVVSGDKSITLAIEVEGKAVGGIGIMPFSDVYKKGGEIGYWLGEQHWNKGIVTEAIVKLTAHAFSYSGLTRISACVFEKNKASMHVLEKAGFHLEAIHRKAVFKNGEILDEYLYVLLKPGN